MTEQEIVEYLKENKHKGVAFAFMSEDVKKWCRHHKDEKIFIAYRGDRWDIGSCICCNYNGIYSLQDDYEINPKLDSQYEEFKIDEDGYFYFNGCRYYYREDVRFEVENSDKFKGFGGWKYNGSEFWNTTVAVKHNDDLYDSYSDNIQYLVKPEIPIKIRFWRYRY